MRKRGVLRQPENKIRPDVKRIRRRYKKDLNKRKIFVVGEENHARAMVVVLRLAGFSHSQIASVVGVSKGQVKKLLSEPEVAQELVELQADLPRAALELLQSYTIEAVQALASVLRETKDDKLIIQAAGEILDRAGIPKVSKSESKVGRTEEQIVKFSDDGMVEKLRQLPPEKQEEAASMIEGLENFLSEQAGSESN